MIGGRSKRNTAGLSTTFVSLGVAVSLIIDIPNGVIVAGPRFTRWPKSRKKSNWRLGKEIWSRKSTCTVRPYAKYWIEKENATI